ncbi:MAG TPA: hypothetical protein DC038_00690 [Clostridiales bacterium]|nr:hypothetical protein [Clostridiales bacterium]
MGLGHITVAFTKVLAPSGRILWEAQFRSQICLLATAHANLELIAFDSPAISFSLTVEEIGSSHKRCG